MMSLPSYPWRKLGAKLTVMLVMLASFAVGGCGGRSSRVRAETSLAEKDRAMLGQYETIRSGLAQDDYRAVKRSAANFQQELETANPPDAKSPTLDILTKIASATGLEPQREAFRSWSKIAIDLTKDVQGFYIIHCPLPNCGDWLQKDPKIDNPYMGKSMHDCGEVQK